MTFRKMSKVDWDAVLDTNLDKRLQHVKPIVDGMVDRGWGRVINVSSVTARRVRSDRPTTLRGQGPAWHGFTKSLALEVARKG